MNRTSSSGRFPARRRGPAIHASLLILLLAACGGSESKPTGVVVVLDSDLVIGDELDAILDEPVEIDSSLFTVEVTAMRNDEELFAMIAETGFVADQQSKLDMFLARRCIAESSACAADETCTQEAASPPRSPLRICRSSDGWPHASLRSSGRRAIRRG